MIFFLLRIQFLSATYQLIKEDFFQFIDFCGLNFIWGLLLWTWWIIFQIFIFHFVYFIYNFVQKKFIVNFANQKEEYNVNDINEASDVWDYIPPLLSNSCVNNHLLIQKKVLSCENLSCFCMPCFATITRFVLSFDIFCGLPNWRHLQVNKLKVSWTLKDVDPAIVSLNFIKS